MSHANSQIGAHLQYGKRLHGAGRLAEAGQVYRQILAAVPAHPEALDLMGVLFLQTGQPAQSLLWFERAIGARGSVPEFHLHQAQALLQLGLWAEAAASSRRAIGLKRGFAEAHQTLGRALLQADDHEGALKAFQDAVRLKPDLLDGLNDLGTAQHHLNRLEEAARTLGRAVAKEPREPTILINLSSVLKSLGRFEEAETRLTAALRLAPDNPHALYNYSLLLLLLGRYEDAWPGWDQRFNAGAVPPRGLTKPVWRGEPLAGRTLLIHAEQGLGDTIQFCRFPFPSGGKVVLEMPRRIARLIASRPGTPSIVTAGEPLPDFDLTCPLMSLPAILGTTFDSVPRDVPYLAAEPDRMALWRDRLGAHGFRIGIAWQGNPTRREDQGRSIALAHYLPLAEVPGVRLISLQKDDGAEQLGERTSVEVLGEDLDPGEDGFIDTAAVMMNLDLIITSDTAVAHLAGALGRPVWVALRAVPDWRWLIGRPDSPWYPTMRLFRQSTRDDWPAVFADIKDALAARMAGGSNG